MCPTVWIGRFSSVIVTPVACKARLHMSHRLDVFLLNLLVKAFTGKLYWETVGDDLYESVFVFRSYAGGF